RKGDLQPDAGSDWKSHVRSYGKDLKRLGIDTKNPTAIHTYAHIGQVRAPHQTARMVGYEDYNTGGTVWRQDLHKSGDDTFATFKARPLIHTVGENHDGVFYHGTNRANIKTLAGAMPSGGFKRDLS